MFLGSGPMSLLGVALASWLASTYGDGVESVEAYAIGVALILGGIGLIAKTLIKIGVQPDDAPFLLTRRDRVIAFAIGAVFGFVVGLTSVHAMAWLLLGSIPGVLLTSQLTVRLPDNALRLGLATTLILSGIKLVDVPGANWIVLAGFVGAGIALLAWGVYELRGRGLMTDLTPS
jgi:uncharacterized membrane protein YfcA